MPRAATGCAKAAAAVQRLMLLCRCFFRNFCGQFACILQALYRVFLKAFCRLSADNLHAVQTFHRLIVIRTCNGLTVLFLFFLMVVQVCLLHRNFFSNCCWAKPAAAAAAVQKPAAGCAKPAAAVQWLLLLC